MEGSSFNVILLVLYFITAPAPGPRTEKDRIWTLQSTSQLHFHSPAACYDAGRDIVDSIEKVDTMTVRVWCFCEPLAGKKCPDRKTTVKTLAPGPGLTIERIGRR